MFNQIIEFLLLSISAVQSWFFSFMDAIPGALTFVFGMFVVYLSYRFLLQPLLHGGLRNLGSDRSKKSYQNNQQKNAK